MERFFIIVFSLLLGIGFYLWFARKIRHKPLQDFVLSHQWLLHPNAICYWRTAMALVAFGLYFFSPYQAFSILLFTLAAILDGIDGIVARSCNLGTKFGEWLDPMCDKLTYLPPLIGFAYSGILSLQLVWTLVIIEFAGQFFARHVLNLLNISGAANNFGKIKAIICFGLVIFCSLLEKIPTITDLNKEVLIACIILAAASIVFKFVPNRLYADILSTLNFFCGVTSLILTYEQRFAWAICIIIVGQLFDLFDGRMAEKHGGTKYGPYLDDIADFVSFGLAPAYMVIKSGGTLAGLFGFIFVAAVAWRLIRFVTVDKKRTDLPEGVFNGLPSPAGALIVLGGCLVVSPNMLIVVSLLSAALMVSHIRFAHFGRIILKQIPKPLFFVISTTIIITLTFVLKTKNAEMFGYLILGSVLVYMVTGRKWIPAANESEAKG